MAVDAKGNEVFSCIAPYHCGWLDSKVMFGLIPARSPRRTEARILKSATHGFLQGITRAGIAGEQRFDFAPQFRIISALLIK
jgi:hypothetical protein